MLHIHPNARTTPATRAEIARSTEPSDTAAQRYGIRAEFVRTWRKRGAGDCLDRSARPHQLAWKTRAGWQDAQPSHSRAPQSQARTRKPGAARPRRAMRHNQSTPHR